MENNELEKELKREIELNLEKEKLEETLEEIKNQTLNFIQKRKDISDYIVRFRKKKLEEYKDDEDEIVKYFDHEIFVKEEAFKFIDRKLRELNILSSSPYFGKIIFEDEYGTETVYIGRFGMDKDEEYEPIIVDWRSPVSALFYAGTLGEAVYKAPMGEIKTNILSKRQFIIKRAKLLGLFDSTIDVKDEVLQMVLSKNAGEKLKDIVMTIQKEQDEIIRQSRKGAVIVDGVAGSGKTTIALHRVAYLLYNYRTILEDKVLILGPNGIFMDYISTVLPSLGEVGVKQFTFKEFAMELLDLNYIMDFKEYMEKILKEDRSFIEDVKYKGSTKYIEELDNLIKRLDYEYFKIKEVKFYDKVIATKEEIEEMFCVYFKDMPLFRRNKKIKRILISKIKDERNILVRKVEKEYKESIDKLSKDELEIQQNNLSFVRKNKIRNIIRHVIEIKNEMKWINASDVIEIYKEFNKDEQFIYDDLAAILYLKIKLEGLKYKKEVKHIVIDEAQDYSMLQFEVLKHLTGCKSFTIVGDSNQRIVPFKGEIAMLQLNKVFSDFDIYNFNLNKSYRSTREIMSFANKYLKSNKTIPLVRNGEKVLEKQVNNLDDLVDKIVENVVKLKQKEYESIAVVCKDSDTVETLGRLIKEKIYISILNEENMIYSGGEVILPSYFAKGLEFDAVILIDNEKFNNKEDKLKYVMATRALHELYVYRTSSIK